MQTVLLVEDSKVQRMVSELLFKKAGYRVMVAADGEEALRVARQVLPDVIVLDMMLPKVSGVELLHSLKLDSTTSKIPVVVLSSLSQKNEGRLLSDGAAAFIEKKYAFDHPESFLETIKLIVDGSAAGIRLPAV